MRISRLVAVLVGAGMALVGPSAFAASPLTAYPPTAPTLTVSANSVAVGGSVSLTGNGFLPLSTASVTWTGAGAQGVGGKAFGAAAAGFRMGAKSLSADASGVVNASVQLMSVGDHTITMAGTAANGSAVSLSAVVTVEAAAASASGNLPHTGAPLLEYMAAGLILVLLGAFVVAVVRNRRRAGATAAVPAAPEVKQPVSH